ncbi:MAG: hypothetical protein Q8T09_11400 [Candidatus Melainabacteria bacterium]|nr:hypothetical protein [Candidatus Melainabacteria bacterium]
MQRRDRRWLDWARQEQKLLALLFAFVGLSCFFATEQLSYQRALSPVEIAALAAAEGLSAIVIDDPYFGRIGLSDCSTGGTAGIDRGDRTGRTGRTVRTGRTGRTVRSINTVLAIVRVELIVADLLSSNELREHAQFDYVQARRASLSLERELSSSLSSGSNGVFLDASGRRVSPYVMAIDSYKKALLSGKTANSSTQQQLPIFALRWSAKQGSTLTHIPAPYKFAFCDSSQESNDCYLPGVDASYKDCHFYFAAVGAQPLLLAPQELQPADGKHFSSLVYAEVPSIDGHGGKASHIACVQPKSCAYAPGPVPFAIELTSDLNGVVKPTQLLQTDFEDRKLCTALFNWLSTTGGRLNIESLLDVLNCDLADSTKKSKEAYVSLFWQIDEKGVVYQPNLPESQEGLKGAGGEIRQLVERSSSAQAQRWLKEGSRFY